MKLNLNNIELQISAGLPKQFPKNPIPQIAFSGRSNVGKSSLINTLVGRKSLARVSGEPGKTITVNFYSVDKKLFLVDLPGYGYAKRTYEDKLKWSSLTDGYFTNNPNIDLLKLVVQLIDSRIGPTSDDRDMMSYMKQCDIPYIVVATKSDKLNATEKKKFSELAVNDIDISNAEAVIMFSSKSGEGKMQVWNEIAARCGGFTV
jgi:GTP-binding protein